ncbi:MAG TPA: hypothetical protein VI585_00155 [Candidatus Binatia bacterium]
MPENFDYKRYLASREWAQRKEAVRKRSGGFCERCLWGDYEATHHLTYANIGNEPLEDLLGVCNACHEYLSAKSDHDPREDLMFWIILGPRIDRSGPRYWERFKNGLNSGRGICVGALDRYGQPVWTFDTSAFLPWKLKNSAGASGGLIA